MEKPLTDQILPTENAVVAAGRKHDHIALAFEAQVNAMQTDVRFYYEPMLAAMPDSLVPPIVEMLGASFRAPLWVSSMTGGTKLAGTINHNLARLCGEFGLGMGLGSCRSLLYDDNALPDFNVRPLMGDTQPLFANLGIAQVEQLLDLGRHQYIIDLLHKLQATGLIVHVNPLQEALQPEGDRYKNAPLHTVSRLLDLAQYPIIVKEVGQGFGPASMLALLKLPLAAIDFGASGGTNFALLELLRTDDVSRTALQPLSQVGHSASEMTDMAAQLYAELGNEALCRQIIVSGGIQGFLDGFHAISRLPVPAVYGQASAFLRHAQGSYEALQFYTNLQINGLALAHQFLKVR